MTTPREAALSLSDTSALLVAELDRLIAAADRSVELARDLNVANVLLGDAMATIVGRDEEIDALNAEIDRLQAIVDGPPIVPVRKTLLGKSGPNNVAGACDRLFYVTGVLTPPTWNPTAPRTHVSWKVEKSPTDAQVISALKTAKPGTKVELWHEVDVKFRKGDLGHGATTAQATLDIRLAMKAAFYDQVKRLREGLLIPWVDVVHTVSSYSVIGSNDIMKYICRADVFGVDLDGGPSFKDYGDPKLLSAVVAHAKAFYGGRWTAPEHGWNDVNTTAIQALRIGVLKVQIPKIAAAGAEEIMFFDSQPSFLLNATELDEFGKLVAEYNA